MALSDLIRKRVKSIMRNLDLTTNFVGLIHFEIEFTLSSTELKASIGARRLLVQDSLNSKPMKLKIHLKAPV